MGPGDLYLHSTENYVQCLFSGVKIMRSLTSIIQHDIQKKMILLAGPRQVGKTHLAQQVQKHCGGRYYNWDNPGDRAKIIHQKFITDKMAVLDELHKYLRWKNFIKGIYDKYHQQLKLLITGSARLDIYRRGSDSLFGRHYLFHLHPLTVGELLQKTVVPSPDDLFARLDSSHTPSSDLDRLVRFGGFPEPFFAGTQREHNRWSMQRKELLIQQDIRDLTQIHMLSLVEHLFLVLPNQAGSLLSINSLKEDLQVAYNTVAQWLEVFERLYISYRLKSYTTKIRRTLHKAQKLYLWDWSQIKDEGARFENLVASHLFKAVTYWRDLGFGDYQLHFLRDSEHREVDFCITKDAKPWLLLEAKLAETQIHEPLRFFCQKWGVPGIQVIFKNNTYIDHGPIKIMSAHRFLPLLP